MDDFFYEGESYDGAGNSSDIDEPEEENDDEDIELVEAILTCLECNNQWDDAIGNDVSENEIFCPWCGSNKIEITNY